MAIGPLTHVDADAAADLSAAVARLRERDCRLILCGVTQRQYKVLRHNGFSDVLEAANICPDLEFAVARGLHLLDEGMVA